jgi:hypothetical protein
MSSTMPRRLGKLFKNQMCATGDARFDMAHPLTADLGLNVTSTPHFSQIDAAMLQALVFAAQLHS